MSAENKMRMCRRFRIRRALLRGEAEDETVRQRRSVLGLGDWNGGGSGTLGESLVLTTSGVR